MSEVIPLRVWYPAIADKWVDRLATLERQGVKVVYEPNERRGWVIHHTVGGAATDPRQYARQVANSHWNKWLRPGGYNFLVGTDARIREMSGLLHVGAHAGTHEWNRAAIGLAFQGDFRQRAPTDSMLNAAREFMASVLVSTDQWTHRQVRPEPTSCPGNALIQLLPLEADMPLTNDDLQKVRQIIWFNADMRDYTTDQDLHAATLLRHARNDAYQAKLDAAVARRLMERGALSSSPLTQSQVDAIAEAVRVEFAEALGG